jgi:ABC-type glycerol-3-phosphate transport system permease component
MAGPDLSPCPLLCATRFINPVLVFSIIVQKYLITGMSLGAIKG